MAGRAGGDLVAARGETAEDEGWGVGGGWGGGVPGVG